MLMGPEQRRRGSPTGNHSGSPWVEELLALPATPVSLEGPEGLSATERPATLGPFEREPEPSMTRHRTTARGVVFLFCLLGLGAAVAAASAHGPNSGTVGKHHKRIIFPLLGRTTYTDNYGDRRPIGTEQGIDIMKPRKSLALAAEAGTVKFSSDSGAGCMLYLYGKSGTSYLYIHLNNDKTAHDDNRGKCGPGMSYAPNLHNGSHVSAGQVIGFTGDSGNASGIPHLEFQVLPHGRKVVDPYPYLNRGRRLLFGTLGSKMVKLSLVGKVAEVNDPFLIMKVR